MKEDQRRKQSLGSVEFFGILAHLGPPALRMVFMEPKLPCSSVIGQMVIISWGFGGWKGPIIQSVKHWNKGMCLFILQFLEVSLCPIGSMYGIFTYIWLISMVNVGKYTIHGSYGCDKTIFRRWKGKGLTPNFDLSIPQQVSIRTVQAAKNYKINSFPYHRGKQTNKLTNKQTNKQTNKLTNKLTKKQTNKQTNKQTKPHTSFLPATSPCRIKIS